MKKLTFILSAILLLYSGASIGALDFYASPGKNGSLDIHLGIDWRYSDYFYSAITSEYKNFIDSSEDETSYVSTGGRSLSIEADFIGVKFNTDLLNINLEANVKWDNMYIRELGYIDQSETRYFILNDRWLNLILPRIKGEVGYKHSIFSFSLGGEYSPWLWVGLTQALTISPGLEKTPYSSGQSATNAFSLNGRLRFDNPVLTPKIQLEYDHLSIAYDVYTAGGEKLVDVLTQTLDGMVTFVFNFIDISDLHPTFSIGYTWDWVTDRSVINAVPQLDESFSYLVGFEF